MTFQRVKLADIGPDTRQTSTGGAELPNALFGHLRGGLFSPAAIGGGTGGTGVKSSPSLVITTGPFGRIHSQPTSARRLPTKPRHRVFSNDASILSLNVKGIPIGS